MASRDFADGNTEAAEQQNKIDEKPPVILAGGHVYKLHGDMDHGERKKNFFGFDKADHSILICTDVASRGLDFKKVEWIVQYDLSSSVKDYVNRVGRTARIATSGSSLCFVMPQEIKYVGYMKRKHGVEMNGKDRFKILREFEKAAQAAFPTHKEDLRFKILRSIEDKDEQEEAIHRLRQIVRHCMTFNESLNLINMAQIAKSSSTRAYTGHGHEMRSIFDINKLNLTEFVRSFGLYKNIASKVTISTKHHTATQAKESKKRLFKDNKEAPVANAAHAKQQEMVAAGAEEAKLYSKRLLKAKQKELERKIYEESSQMTSNDRGKMEGELKRLKREVYVNEWKVEQRRVNFEKARHSTGKKVLDEFI